MKRQLCTQFCFSSRAPVRCKVLHGPSRRPRSRSMALTPRAHKRHRLLRHASMTISWPKCSVRGFRDWPWRLFRVDVFVKLQGYGYANLEHEAPVKAETVFQSGSLGQAIYGQRRDDAGRSRQSSARRPDQPVSWPSARKLEAYHRQALADPYFWDSRITPKILTYARTPQKRNC